MRKLALIRTLIALAPLITASCASNPYEKEADPSFRPITGYSIGTNSSAEAYRNAITVIHTDAPRGYLGDPDTDFANILIHHYKESSHLAWIELQYGNDDEMRKLAANIDYLQSFSYIENRKLNEWLKVKGFAHQNSEGNIQHPQSSEIIYNLIKIQNRMEQSMGQHLSGDGDKDFAYVMTAYNQAAIDLANLELKYGCDDFLRKTAQSTIHLRERENNTIQNWLFKHHF